MTLRLTSSEMFGRLIEVEYESHRNEQELDEKSVLNLI